MYLLGYDIGSSSVKAALVEAETGETVGRTQFPATEMVIDAPQVDWAEQAPEKWWECVCQVTKKLLHETSISPDLIQSIGIAYQMHGLVLVDKNQEVLRPAIIWCDSRAVAIGDAAFSGIGEEYCLQHYLNSPGNFTASKLRWVQENEPKTYAQIDKIMLPGDYIAMRLSGEIATTVSGLSEGVFWDFKNHQIASKLLDYYSISPDLLPNIVETFARQGKLHTTAAAATGLQAGTPITYRAGDQPNNALSLGVFRPNEIAATGGTSGVIYGISEQLMYDKQSRINGFAHVNHTANQPRIGQLLCINGAGIQYAWLKNQIAQRGTTYAEMEAQMQQISVGADGLRVFPFGNGAERMLGNKNVGAHIQNLQFNRHTAAHLYRAALEGIAFSFVFGGQILRDLGLIAKVIKVGNDNLFQSPTFAQTIANLMNCELQMMDTTGAIGAAKASGIGTGFYQNLEEATQFLQMQQVYHPEKNTEAHQEAFASWKQDLERQITIMF